MVLIPFRRHRKHIIQANSSPKASSYFGSPRSSIPLLMLRNLLLRREKSLINVSYVVGFFKNIYLDLWKPYSKHFLAFELQGNHPALLRMIQNRYVKTTITAVHFVMNYTSVPVYILMKILHILLIFLSLETRTSSIPPSATLVSFRSRF